MMLRFVLTIIVVSILVVGSAVAGTIEENKELVSKFIAADNTKDYEELPTYITEDFKRHSDASPNVNVANRDQFIEHMRDGDQMFLDTKIYVQQMIAEGDRVAVWARYQGRVGSQGAQSNLDLDVSMIYRIEGNNIAELWVLWDNNALRSQLKAQAEG